MGNIIKAMNYQIKNDKVTYFGVLLSVFLSCSNLIGCDLSEVTGSSFISMAGDMTALLPMFVILILSVRICGWDYTDKTINYEILAGHHRRDVYFARAVLAIVWSVLICLVGMLVPVFIFTAINGWGDTMEFKGMMLRFALSLFPMLRMTSQYILLVFLTRNVYISWATGYMATMFSMMINMMIKEFLSFEFTWHFSSSNLMKIFTFNQSLGYVNNEDVVICQTSLESSFVAGTIVASLVISLICIGFGYIFFKKSDIS